MARRQRECYLCGKTYQYCGSCSQDRAKPAWMAEFHSESCKNIFDICTRFNLNMITKKEAQEELSACDLSNKENFKSYVQKDLENIFAEDITVELEAEIKEVDVVVETSVKGNKNAKSHVVVLTEEK